MNNSRMIRLLWIGLCIAVLTGLFFLVRSSINQKKELVFNEKIAMNYLEEQIAMGPRTPGSIAHAKFLIWAERILTDNDWTTEKQQGEILGHPLVNLIGKKGQGEKILLLTAHYDSRLIADNEPSYPEIIAAVPGANDGASGVAVLMELARVIEIPPDCQIWIVLFDIEDNGRLPGWNWILGSTYFVNTMTIHPTAIVNLDMVGDEDLQIFPESTSTKELTERIWDLAKSMGYGDYFSTSRTHGIIDDHTPFLDKGMTAVDIIDIDYPYHHTLQDDISHVSSRSLGIVGRVIERWVEEY